MHTPSTTIALVEGFAATTSATNSTTNPATNSLACGSPELRALFPHLTTRKLYLDHASVGPIPQPAREAMERHLRERTEGAINTYFGDIELLKQTRALAAQLVNAESAERIAFCMNTSDALNIVAAGLRWQSGDRVILNDQEFPSNVYPYRNLTRLGVEIDTLATRDGEVTPEMIERAIVQSGGRAKLVSLSATQFLSGYRADLAAIGEICRRRGVVFVVDAIQAAGATPLDVQAMKIDALATGGQKWLLSTTGVAFLYITEALQERIEQAHLGWISVEKPWDFFRYDQPLSRSASRYENGTLNFPGIIGLGASLRILLNVHPRNTERHLEALTQILIEELPESGIFESVPAFPAERRAGIVSGRLHNAEQGERVHAELGKRGVTISLREGRLRFSPHCYNTADDVRECMETLRAVIRETA